jgi:hypothetical protein
MIISHASEENTPEPAQALCIPSVQQTPGAPFMSSPLAHEWATTNSSGHPPAISIQPAQCMVSPCRQALSPHPHSMTQTGKRLTPRAPGPIKIRYPGALAPQGTFAFAFVLAVLAVIPSSAGVPGGRSLPAGVGARNPLPPVLPSTGTTSPLPQKQNPPALTGGSRRSSLPLFPTSASQPASPADSGSPARRVQTHSPLLQASYRAPGSRRAAWQL